MICPKCGLNLKEGHVFCEGCGEEIQMVPDFEPEIEDNIYGTLSGLIEDDNDETSKTQVQKHTSKIKLTRFAKKIIILTLMGLCFVGIVTAVLIRRFVNNSYEYQLTMAETYMAEEEYDEAIMHLERADELGEVEQDYVTQLKLAEVYLEIGKNETAEELLQSMCSTYPNNLEVYKKLISIYEIRKEYSAIQDLLMNCTDEKIRLKFKAYMSQPPQFSLESGDYSEVISLKLMSDVNGSIYYTLDGRPPTKEDNEYQTEIILKDGIYEISAIFVNSNGVESECVSSTYKIAIKLPEAPKIIPKSNIYTEPVAIAAKAEEGMIYYSIDGSVPTDKSKEYTHPIPMPLGKSIFKFITVTEHDILSEVTTANYELNFPALVTETVAVDAIKWMMYQKGEITDLKGSTKNASVTYDYRCNSAVKAGSRIYYLVEEFYLEKINQETIERKTEKEFAVDVRTGELYTAILSEGGSYEFSLFY